MTEVTSFREAYDIINQPMNIIHNLTDPKTGNTYKEDNLKRDYAIPLHTLVEVSIEDSDENGLRLFVVSHDRDCDGTPFLAHEFLGVTGITEVTKEEFNTY